MSEKNIIDTAINNILQDRELYGDSLNNDGGFRSRHRILFSNDGLIFASYDHYQTFYEITN